MGKLLLRARPQDTTPIKVKLTTNVTIKPNGRKRQQWIKFGGIREDNNVSMELEVFLTRNVPQSFLDIKPDVLFLESDNQKMPVLARRRLANELLLAHVHSHC